MARPIREADIVCQCCGEAIPAWQSVVVPVASRCEYLCRPCYDAQQADTAPTKEAA